MDHGTTAIQTVTNISSSPLMSYPTGFRSVGAYTISFWMMPTTTAQEVIVQLSAGGGNRCVTIRQYTWSSHGETIGQSTEYLTTNKYRFWSNALTDANVWKHFVLIDTNMSDPDYHTYICYEDGVLRTSAAGSSTGVGGLEFTPNGFIDVAVDRYNVFRIAHLALWNRALTQGEAIAMRRKSPLFFPDGLMFYDWMSPPVFKNRVEGVQGGRAPIWVPSKMTSGYWMPQLEQPVQIFSLGSPPILYPINITPDPAVASADSVDPIPRQGSISYGPASLSAGTDTANPAVTLGNINATPSPAVVVTSRSGPQVFLSSVSVAPNARAAKAARSDPSVRLGSIQLDIDSATAVADGADPSIHLSGQTVSPSPAVVSVSVTGPKIDDNKDIYTSPISVATSTTGPTLFWSSVSTTPDPATSKVVAINPQDLPMYAVTASATAQDPQVYVGELVIGIYPAAAESTTEAIDPSLYWSSHSSTPDPASVATDVVDPTYYVYNYTVIWPTPAASIPSSDISIVSLGPLVLSPDMAEAATDVVSPDLFFSSMSYDPAEASAITGTAVGAAGAFFRYFLKADTSIGDYTDENDGTTDIYKSVDEDPHNDADYIKSDWNPQQDSYIGKLQSVSDPDTDTSHYIEYRYKKDNTLSRIDIVVRLYQDDIVITGWSHDDIGTDFVTKRQLLDETDAALITDYTKLRVEIEASEV